MSARSLIQKIKQLVGVGDSSDTDVESAPAETGVTVEREPDMASEAGRASAEDEELPAEPETDETEPETDEEPEVDEELETDEETEDESEPVEKIKGIGPTYRDRLVDGGIETVADLAASDAETVADVAETTEGRAADWVERAQNR